MEAACLDHIIDAYEKHPLSAATILDRLRRQRGGILGITEMDVARDNDSFITDQNHTGGLDAVIKLAQAIPITREHRILDIGTGLGGTPRVISHLYGSQSHGVELTESRYRDGLLLTELVGLTDLVLLTCGDFLSLHLPNDAYDIAIGQGTFMHFADPTDALCKCRKSLVAGGRLVIEDGYLCHQPRGSKQCGQTESAWTHWNGQFQTLDDWQKSLTRAGFEVQTFNDQTEIALDEYEQQLRAAQKGGLSIARTELEGWRLGEDLIREGVIGMMRLICRKT